MYRVLGYLIVPVCVTGRYIGHKSLSSKGENRYFSKNCVGQKFPRGGRLYICVCVMC